MNFQKMPRGLFQDFEGEELMIVLEILYFADGYTGEIKSKQSSLATKYGTNRVKLFRTFVKLMRNNYVTKCGESSKYYSTVISQDCNEPVTEVKQTCNKSETIKEKRREEKRNNIVEQKPDDVVKRVVKYLNEKIDAKYTSTSSATVRKINARKNEGFTFDDFKRVIDTKCSEWLNTEHQKYLRPQTLFGSKFESYLNQPVIKSEKDLDNELLRALGEDV